jgi:hypothetical protein
LYLDDFDQNGQTDLIIYYTLEGMPTPFATRDELIDQMPELKKQFVSYTDFSKVTDIQSLLGPWYNPSTVTEKNIYELRSMLFLSDELSLCGQLFLKRLHLVFWRFLYLFKL